MAVTVDSEPRDDELVELLWHGDVAKAFLVMLNMNKIVDGQGRRLVFHWRKAGRDWYIEETSITT
mgnify:CR=1 FL=1